MIELLQNIVSIPAPFNMIVLVCLIFSVAGVISSLFKQVRKYTCHRQELDFKRELVERGLNVDEIERIVAARSVSEKQSDDS
jgi:hypothetical protein